MKLYCVAESYYNLADASINEVITYYRIISNGGDSFAYSYGSRNKSPTKEIYPLYINEHVPKFVGPYKKTECIVYHKWCTIRMRNEIEFRLDSSDCKNFHGDTLKIFVIDGHSPYED